MSSYLLVSPPPPPLALLVPSPPKVPRRRVGQHARFYRVVEGEEEAGAAGGEERGGRGGGEGGGGERVRVYGGAVGGRAEGEEEKAYKEDPLPLLRGREDLCTGPEAGEQSRVDELHQRRPAPREHPDPPG